MANNTPPNPIQRHLPTGVSDETYDLLTTLSNKLEELWRIEEFMDDQEDDRDRAVWRTIQEHDRQDVTGLLRALKQHLNQISL